MIKYIITVIILLFLSFTVIRRFAQRDHNNKEMHEQLLIVATNAEFPPFTFIKNGDIVGFDIDVVSEVARRLDKKIIFKDLPFDSLIIEAIKGSVHVVAAGLTCTPERQKKLSFTKPYIFGDPLVIISKKNNEIKTIDTLKEKTVIVNEGFTADTYMSQLKDIDVMRIGTIADAFAALQAGRGDAFVSSLNSLQPFFAKYGKETFAIHPIPNTDENCSLGVSKQYPELYNAIESVIDSMIIDGTITRLKEKWAIA